MRWTSFGTVLSLALHAGAAAAVALIPKSVERRAMKVAVVESKKKKETPKDEPAPDKPPPPPKAIEAPVRRAAPRNTPPPEAPAKPAAAPSPVAPAPNPALAALPNLGIQMAGGVGPGGGIAVPVNTGGDAPQAAEGAGAPRAAAPKPKDDCAEDAVKPKAVSTVQPQITDAARSAGVEGKVRLEILVDANGAVTDVRVLAGLGHGLDEAAAAAARRWKFTAGTRCGRAVAGRVVANVRFVLGD